MVKHYLIIMDLVGMSNYYEENCIPQYGCHQLSKEYLDEGYKIKIYSD